MQSESTAIRLGCAACVWVFIAGGGSARAEWDPANLDLDPTIYRDGDTYLKPTIQVDSAVFAESNAWLGESRANVGDHVGYFGEFGVVPGLEGALSLDGKGTLRARVSGVWTTTQFGLDAAGSNFDDRYPAEITVEDAYVGWSSGDLFPALGEDAIDVSFGSQKYQVGNGFLFWDGATDGGSRGGYWLGMRKAFRMAGIAKLATGPFVGRAVYLQPNDLDNTNTDVLGVDLEWTFGERGKLGGGYWNFVDSDDFRRDGLDVFDLRGEVHPLDFLPGLVVSGEVSFEKNHRLNESWGGWAEIGYAFDDIFAKPYLSYRYSGFTGDRGTASAIEAFDPLFYGMSDWDTWYLGEIFGGWVGTNRNLDAHTVRLRVEPAEDWKVNLVALVFQLDEFATDLQPRLFDPRVVSIRDKDLGEEVDLIVDWSMNDHLMWSVVLGALFPSNGLEQATGGNEVWTHAMLYASFSF
jgi:hypothetical protein